MRFDLVDLALFVAVAETGSITRGAGRSNLALASASARIKALETTLQVALLKRERRGVTLTAAGESLLDHARIVLHNVDIMRGELAIYAKGLKASVHMLANTAGLSEHLPRALASFLTEHPDISVDVEERESAVIAQAIASGAADLGLAIDSAVPRDLERFAFCDDRLVVVTNLHDPLARRRQIDFRETLAHHFVGLPTGHALQDHVASQAALLGARLQFRARLRDFGAICQMVAAGVGIAVMPEAAARRGARTMKLALIRIRDPWARRTLSVCMRSFKTLPRPTQLLVEHLRKAAQP